MKTRKWISALLCASMILAVPLPVSAGEITQQDEAVLESIQEENLDAQENATEGSVAEQSLETEVTDENSQEEIIPESEMTESIEPEQEEIVLESELTEESNPKPEETAPESEATEESDSEPEETIPESEATEESDPEPEETVPESEPTEESNPEPEETVLESEVTEESNSEQEEDIEKSDSEADKENTETSGETDAEKQEANEIEARAATALAIGPRETENNNSQGTADTIYPNQSVNGNISSNSDVDWYRVTLNSNCYISLTLSHSYIDHGGSHWTINLYNSNSELYSMSVSGTETSKRSCRMGLPRGTYYVEVRDGSWHSNINYNLRVNYVATNYWETETNNSIDTADSIATNKSVTGSLHKNSDSDYFKFSLGSDGYISLTLNHNYIDSGGNYWNIRLFKGSDGALLEEFNYQGNVSSQRSCRVGLPKGTYYVEVRDATWYSDVDYNLRVNYVAASYWETEANNSISTADNISPNVSVTGCLIKSNDTDYYKFSTGSNGYISLTLNHTYIDSGGNYWRIRLYRGTDTTLIEEFNYQGNITSQKSCRIGLPKGTYYIEVSDATWHSNFDYNLRVNYVADKSYETEINNTTSTADTIIKNVVSRGTLMANNDVDYYTFSLAAKCYVNFRLTHGYIDDNSKMFTLTVRNVNNAPVFEYSLTGRETGTNQGLVLPAGKYYVSITDANSHSTTPYGLLVQPII